MWFWIIIGFIMLTILGRAAREARQEQRDKRREEELKEINEKLEDQDPEEFLDEVRDN